MHIIKDENGNLCSHAHAHEHAHTHTYEHTHEHMHEHGQEDVHTHTHEGEHASCGGHCHGDDGGHCHNHDGHCHGHEEHAHEAAPAEKNAALLKYMLDHNTHHAAELDQMAAKLAGDGQNEAAEQIRRAVDEFQKGNMYLGLALSLVKES